MKKRLLYRYVTSHLLMAVVPTIAFGVVFFFLNIVELQRETRTFNYGLLIQAQNRIDYLYEELKNVALHLSTRDEIHRHLIESNPDPTLPSMIAGYVGSYQSNLSLPAEIVYYKRGADYVVTNDGHRRYDAFEHQYARDGSFTHSAFFTRLNQVQVDTTTRVINTRTHDNRTAWMSYHFPIPLFAPIPRGTVVFLIRGTDIAMVFETYLGEFDPEVLVYDRHGTLVFSSRDISREDAEHRFRTSRGIGVSQDPEAGDTITMRSVSENTDFTFLVRISRRDFYGKVGDHINTLLAVVFVLLAIGALMAVRVALRDYRPLNKLVTEMGVGDELSGDSTEIEALENYWQTTRTQLETQQIFARDLGLNRLLHGKFQDSEDALYHLRMADVVLPFSHLFVGVIDVNSTGLGSVMREKVITVAGTATSATATVMPVETIMDGDIALVINIDSADEAEHARVCRDVRRIIEGALGVSVKIGIGSPCDGPEQIHRSFMEAIVALQESTGGRNDGLFLYRKSIAPGDTTEWPIIEMALLLQSLKRGDKKTAELALDDVFANIRKESVDSFTVRCLSFDVVNTMIKSGASFAGSDERLSALRLSTTIDDRDHLECTARDAAFRICDEVLRSKDEKNSNLRDALTRYVDENFRSPGFSLESVADQFGLTPTHVSRVFKTETGFRFIQYVTMLRMEYIKAKLTETDDRIQDIVKSAGYIDVASFMRKFRVHEGVTPGQFRQMTRRTPN